MQLHSYFQTIHSVLLKTFYRNKLLLKANGRLQFGENLTHQCTKISQRENLCFFFIKKLPKLSEFYYLESGLCPTLTDIFEAMNTLILERHNHSESCITLKASRKTQKVEIHLAKEASGLAFFSTDLEYLFSSNVGNEFGVMLRGKGPHKPEIAHDIVCIHSHMMYTDHIEYNIVGDTKTPLQRCFLFI